MASSNPKSANLGKGKNFHSPGARKTDENIFVIHNSRNKVHPASGDNLETVDLTDQPMNRNCHPPSAEAAVESITNKGTVKIRKRKSLRRKKQHKSFLRIFVRIAPYLLLRPLRKEDAIKNKYGIILQRVLFVVFNVLAFVNTLGNIKYHVLQKNEMNIVVFWAVLLYYINNFILRLCCIYITCFKWKGLYALTEKTQSGTEAELKNNLVKCSTQVVVAFVIVSVGVACANPLVEAGIKSKWDGHFMILYHTKFFVGKILQWSTATPELLNTYLQNSTVSACLAFLQVLMECAGDLQLHLMIDLTLTAAMTMHSETRILTAKIKASKPSDHKDETKTKAVLLPYYDVRSFHETLDETFNFTLQFLILDNLLFCVYMGYNHGLSETAAVLVILDLLILIKVGWFIISSVRAASVNDVFRKWVRTSFPRDGILIANDKPKVTMASLFDEITNDPIGVGSSIFFMNRGFIYGFLRGVTSGSLFLLDNE